MYTYEAFVAVVELSNISAAAKKLHKSPSSVSKQISGLEQKLGVQLLDRTTRAVTVTEAGNQFYQKCVNILKLLEEAEGELKDTVDETCGKIKITWPAPISYSRIPEVLGEFSVRYPKVKLDIDVNIKVFSFVDSNLDFAFRLGELDDSRLVAVNLGHVRPIICASAVAVDRWGFPKEMSDFREFPIITQSNVNIMQKGKEVFRDLRKLPFDERCCVNDIGTMRTLAKSHMGATILFQHMVEDELKSGEMVQLVPNSPLKEQPINLVYRRLDYMPKRLRHFVDFFKEEFSTRDPF